MAAAGTAVAAAGLLAAPGTSPAQTDLVDDPGVTAPSITIPPELAPAVGEVERLTGSTLTTTSTTTTTTTTTVPTPESTTTTTTTPLTQSDEQQVDEEVEVLGAIEVAPLEELLAAIEVPVIDVPAIVADYGRTDFPAYTPRFGKRSTLEVVQLLESRGLSLEEQARVIAPFPVAGAASYTDDWAAPRYTPYFHLHEGTDIFAEHGTPVIATMAGTVTRTALGSGAGGNVVYLTLDDGTYFYYAHLDTISPLVYPGMAVEPGQVLGTVGDTGNAEGGMPHLHFEIHPGGGDPVPPAPYLDAWLAAALDEARLLGGAAVAPPPFPGALAGPTQAEAGVLPAQPASFGRESTGTLVFILPGAAVLWWRRRRALAALNDRAASVK